MMHSDKRYSAIVPFSCLQCNQSGSICELIGDECAVQRLKEMGLREGVQMQMMRSGSPCIVAVEGRRYSLRLDSGADILVETSH